MRFVFLCAAVSSYCGTAAEPDAFGRKEGSAKALADFKPERRKGVPDPSVHAISRSRLSTLYARDGPLDATFVFQYFKNPSAAEDLLKGVAKCFPKGSGKRIEVIVNVDDNTPESAAAWHKLARASTDFPVLLFFPNNIHEVRAYNRLGRAGRGRIIFMMQDDDRIDQCKWIFNTFKIFDTYEHVGLVGTNVAQTLPCSEASTRYWCSAHKSPLLKIPMQFIGCVDIGPFVARRSAVFDVGGFDEGISPAGFPGIGLDFDISIRMWLLGWGVVHYPADGIARHKISPKEGKETRNTQGAQGGIRGALWSTAGAMIVNKYRQYLVDEKLDVQGSIDRMNKELLQPSSCEDTQEPSESWDQWLVRNRKERDSSGGEGAGWGKVPAGQYYTGRPLWSNLAELGHGLEKYAAQAEPSS